jgi:hypothetical protein
MRQRTALRLSPPRRFLLLLLLLLLQLPAAEVGAIWDQPGPRTSATALIREVGTAPGELGEGWVVPDQLIVKFRGEAARAAPQALRNGFAVALGAAQGADLDGLVARHRVASLRRVFRGLERPDGSLRSTARERAASLRQRFPRRAARARAGVEVPELENVYLLQLGPGADLGEAMRAFSEHPQVEYAEPNVV